MHFKKNANTHRHQKGASNPCREKLEFCTVVQRIHIEEKLVQPVTAKITAKFHLFMSILHCLDKSWLLTLSPLIEIMS